MAADNTEQIAYWNGAPGERWAAMRRETDGIVLPFGAAAMSASAPQQGERVIDVGCGCGDTAIELARRVGANGAVLGVDVSQPMLEVARECAALARLPQLAFREADASAADLPAETDLLYSRFGVMFFGDPAAAFAHMRALAATGRPLRVRLLAGAARQSMDDGAAFRRARGARHRAGARDPNAPGPFAFADDARLRAILTDAGFGAIETRASTRRLARRNTACCRGRRHADRAYVPVVARGGGDKRARDHGCDREGACAAGRARRPRKPPGSTWIVSAKNP